MFTTKKPEVLICQESEAKIHSRRFLSESFCLQEGSDINYMTELCRARLTSFYQNIKQLFLFMDASGMVMRDANILLFLKLAELGGFGKLTVINSLIQRIKKN